jgi:hypothetical protein
MIYSDIQLAQRLERTEGRANADFVETRRQMFPDSDACWIEVGGTYAMFDGIDSPLTQTFGLGMFEDATSEHLGEIETFFKERQSSIFHEVSPMADMSLLGLLNSRGYFPVELTSVMYLDLSSFEPPLPIKPGIIARPIEPAEADLWAEVAAAGWSTEHPSLADFMLAFGKIAARTHGGHPFMAELDGRPVAAGGFQMFDDVCILAGASTVPDARRLGAQNALLNARLCFAAESGCTLAMMGALPGSQSQKNAQKNGFNIAYTRTKWQLTV